MGAPSGTVLTLVPSASYPVAGATGGNIQKTKGAVGFWLWAHSSAGGGSVAVEIQGSAVEDAADDNWVTLLTLNLAAAAPDLDTGVFANGELPPFIRARYTVTVGAITFECRAHVVWS